MSEKFFLESPNGIRIRGTLESISAVKGIHRIKPDPDKGFAYEEEDERTELGSVDKIPERVESSPFRARIAGSDPTNIVILRGEVTRFDPK